MQGRAASTYAEIEKCLKFGQQQSFLLPAGAGAGKTRALTTAIRSALSLNEEALFFTGAQIAAITYTRAAAEEILHRIEYDPRVWVSTIHSFAWEMIKPHPLAIRDVLITQLSAKLQTELDLKKKERSSTTPTSIARSRSIRRHERRLNLLPTMKRFYYSPESDKPVRGELSHAEVISVFAELLVERPLMKSFLVSRFPVVLIDEAQDTTKSLLPRFIDITRSHNSKFTLGLFGDMMQRVYLAGVQNLEADIPLHWRSIPPLSVNYRSDQRIVELANQIRSQPGSAYAQEASSASRGIVRFFALPRDSAGYETELLVQKFMAAAGSDAGWVPSGASASPPTVKTLVLEHRFAADRLGFLEFYEVMSVSATREKMFGREDIWPPIVRFLEEVATFVGHIQDGRLRKADRQLARIRSGQAIANPIDQDSTMAANVQPMTGALRRSAQHFRSLIENEECLTLVSILRAVRTSEVFRLTEEAEDCLLYFEGIPEASPTTGGSEQPVPTETDNSQEELEAWSLALPLAFDQFVAYLSYRKGTSGFDTQQGVKGLEFPRVLVILNDSEARGKLFQYDKFVLDGGLSSTDEKNEVEGKDTGPARARRLFYVSCTRAEHGLAVVYYGDVAAPLGKEIRELFPEDEIISWEQLAIGAAGGEVNQLS